MINRISQKKKIIKIQIKIENKNRNDNFINIKIC